MYRSTILLLISVLLLCIETSAVCGDIDKHNNHISGEEHILQLVYLCISYIGRTRNIIFIYSVKVTCVCTNRISNVNVILVTL